MLLQLFRREALRVLGLDQGEDVVALYFGRRSRLAHGLRGRAGKRVQLALLPLGQRCELVLCAAEACCCSAILFTQAESDSGGVDGGGGLRGRLASLGSSSRALQGQTMREERLARFEAGEGIDIEMAAAPVADEAQQPEVVVETSAAERV